MKVAAFLSTMTRLAPVNVVVAPSANEQPTMRATDPPRLNIIAAIFAFSHFRILLA
jgi:hypothetical protein